MFGFYILYKKLRDEHLVVDENRVEYIAPGIVMDVYWKDIEKISKHWRYGFRHECLLVDNSKISHEKMEYLFQ